MNHEIIKRVIADQHQVIKDAVIVDRDIELERDVNYVLVGLRRAGKSTLLYQRVQNLIKEGMKWEQIIYINFDDERLDGFQLSDFDDILLTAEEMTSEKHYYYFDEIQNIDGWEKFAIRMANQNHKVDITGSNAKMLSGEIASRLGGRYIAKEITPYSFNEYLRANNIDKSGMSIKELGRINALLNQYFRFGGFPASLQFANKREYASSIYQKILFGDILTHYQIRNTNGIKLLIRKIAESVRNDISYTKLQNAITGVGYKLSKDTIIDYVGYFKEVFLVFSLENYYSSFVDKYSYPKYYFMDNGILNLFLDNKDSALLENVVAINLYRKHRDQLYYLKGDATNIDFYLSEKNIAIQVAYSLKEKEAEDREVDNLIAFAKSQTNNVQLFIVTYDEERTIVKDDYKITVLSLRKVLA
ncbi:MAG: ATP-binding protein [Bacilli bacterium]|nr:ATP-binding protein [Bacilli bacterium]